MDGQVRLTEAEKERRLRQIRAGFAFDGIILSPDVEQGLRDIMDGKITEDEYFARVRVKYAKYMLDD